MPDHLFGVLLTSILSTMEGTKLFAQTSSDGFQQQINEPTHIQKK